MNPYNSDSANRFIQRFFEILPGVLVWTFIFLPIWGGLSFPYILINLLVVLSVYWVYRSFILTVGVLIGYSTYKQAQATDWLEECNKLNRAEMPENELLPSDSVLPNHLIVIPNYGEDYEIIKRSINALLNQNYPLDRLYIAVSIEERKAKNDPEYAKRGEYLKADFGDKLGDRLMFFVHPADIPGEAPGAASNRTWGVKQSVEELERRGLDISKFLVTAPDGDLVFEPQFLAACSYKWITSVKRNNKFYQTAIYTFNNNYWDVPILVRILMINITLPVLASSVFEKQKKETWSCFTLNLKLVKDVDYWDTSISVGADDTTFYWRPYFHLHGDWTCEVFFIGLKADAVYNANYFRNHVDQYKQYLRWGWGVITVPLALPQLFTDKRIPVLERVLKIYHLFEVFVFWKVLAFLITFGVPLIIAVNSDIKNEVISVTVPQTISTLLTLALILLLPNTYIKSKLIPPKPSWMKRSKFILVLLIEIPLTVVSLLTLGFFPFIEATTRMMLQGGKNRKVTWAEKKLPVKNMI